MTAAALHHHRDLPVPIEIKPVANARRMRLRYDERRGILTLTCPVRLNRRHALNWAAEQQEWVRIQLVRTSPRRPIADGSTIPLEGVDVALRWSPDAPRTPQLRDGMLVCGGPAEAFGPRIEAHLKRLARDTLSRETAEYAARAGVTCRSVTIGDATTRWGSCSSAGRIRYSWRLIMAPPLVRRFVVAHEVAHLAHLDHGPEFKALERQLLEGDVASARRLLREVGGILRSVVGRI